MKSKRRRWKKKSRKQLNAASEVIHRWDLVKERNKELDLINKKKENTIMHNLEELKVWTDGACFPNPGKGGWAWTTLQGDSDSGSKDNTTNNYMELMAVLKAVESLHKSDRALIIISDSQYVVKGLNDWYKGWILNGWVTKSGSPVLYQELWEEILSYANAYPIFFRWVKSRSGDPGNIEADRLAVLASGASPEMISNFSKLRLITRKFV